MRLGKAIWLVIVALAAISTRVSAAYVGGATAPIGAGGTGVSGTTIGPVQNVATSISCSASLAPAVTISSSSNSTALILIFAGNGSTTNPTVSGITDTNSVTWHKAVSAGSNSSTDSEIWYALSEPAGAVTVTVALTAGSGTCFTGANLSAFSNVGALDKTVSNNCLSACSTTLSTGTSSATTSANELVIGAIAEQVANGNPFGTTANPAGATEFMDPGVGSNHSTTLFMLEAWRNVSSTGTQNMSWTQANGNTTSWYGTLATFTQSPLTAGHVDTLNNLLGNAFAGFGITGNTHDWGCSPVTGTTYETNAILTPSAGGAGSGGGLVVAPAQHADPEPISGMYAMWWTILAQIDNTQSPSPVILPKAGLSFHHTSGTWVDNLSPTSIEVTVAGGQQGTATISGTSVGICSPSCPATAGAGEAIFSSPLPTPNPCVQTNFEGVLIPMHYGLNPTDVLNGANSGDAGLLE